MEAETQAKQAKEAILAMRLSDPFMSFRPTPEYLQW